MAIRAHESVAVTGDTNYFLKKRIRLGITYVVLFLVALYTLAPLWFLFTNSFKGQADIIRNPLGAPANFTFDYIGNAIEQIHFFRSLGITFLITLFSVGLIVVISSVGAW